MGQRQLLVLGNLKGAAKAALEVARRDAQFECVTRPRADEAILELDSGEFRAMVVDLTTPGAARFCHEARARRALFNVPLIALSPKLTDLAFSNALRWGADDVVMLGAAEPLRARLDSLPKEIAPLAAATRGEAVIADPERSRCDVLGRVLANAGFSVKYATDTVATRFYLGKPSVSLFVINSELGDVRDLASEALNAGSTADWVITTKTLNVEADRARLAGIPRLVVMSSHGPPENVLFALNLLRPHSEASRRAEVRALHGAITLFRPVGLDHDEFGFTYSVSSGGLYVRTLLPCPSERLWLELTPPNVPRRVKLLGELAWSRTFGEAGAETAPPGFGVRILDGLGDDLELWHQGFRSLDIRVPSGGVPEVKTSSSSFRVPLPSNRPPKPEAPAPAAPSLLGSRAARVSTSPIRSSLTMEVPDETTDGSTNPSREERTTTTQHDKPRSAVEVPKTMWHAPEYTPQGPPATPSVSASGGEAVLAAMRKSLPPGYITLPVNPVPPAAEHEADTAVDTPAYDGPPITDPLPVVTPTHETAAVEPNPGELSVPQLDTPTFDGSKTAAMPAITADAHAADPSNEALQDDMVPSPSAAPPMTASLPPPITLEQLERERAEPGPEAPAPPGLGDFSTARASQGSAGKSGYYLADEDLLSVPPDAGELKLDVPPIDAPELPNVTTSPADPTPSPPPPPPKKAFGGAIAAGVIGAAGLLAALFLGPRVYDAVTRTPGAPPAGTDTAATGTTEADTASPSNFDDPSSLAVGASSQTAGPASTSTSAATSRDTAASAEPTGERPGVPQSDVAEQPGQAEETPPSPTQAADPSERPGPVPPAPDATGLAETAGYLYVSSTIDAAVFVHGVAVGRTNEWLESHCGFRFIRLGRAPGQWLSPGLPTKLGCRKSTQIELLPD